MKEYRKQAQEAREINKNYAINKNNPNWPKDGVGPFGGPGENVFTD